MVLKKTSFKTVLNNKIPIISNLAQSPKVQSKISTNEQKIDDYIPKIKTIPTFCTKSPLNEDLDADRSIEIPIEAKDAPSPIISNIIAPSPTLDITPNPDDILLEGISDEDINEISKCVEEDIIDTSSAESLSSQTDTEVFKIVLATDTHLGYKDDDVYLAEDSINTFHEILYLADKLNADCIFHSGDLFDQNKPSRRTLYKTMELLNKYCLGQRTRTFDVVDANGVFDRGFVDSKHNVKLPIFIIHGNHDNPSAEHGLSAIDLLNIAGLVNYFGKVEDFVNIRVKPILLKKNNTKIALYGIGWIKDERLLRAFQTNNIEFLVPNNLSEWTCILLFHQNRYRSSGPSAPMESCIPESYIPDFIDLVIWGHEHESKRAPVKDSVKNHRTLQLGSSIITSLIESEMLPKHSALLEVRRDGFKIYPIRLETVRPLLYREVVLADSGVPPEEKAVWDHLALVVQELLNYNSSENAPLDNVLSLTQLVNNVPNIDYDKEFDEIISKVRNVPLVRLKIEYSGFPTINPKSFGSQFVNKIANPFEILRFHRKRAPRGFKVPEKSTTVAVDFKETDSKGIFDIIYERSLEKGNELNFFSEYHLNLAVQQFVLDMDSKAISSYVSKYIEEVKLFITNEYGKFELESEEFPKFVQEKAIERANKLRTEIEKGDNITNKELISEPSNFDLVEENIKRQKAN